MQHTSNVNGLWEWVYMLPKHLIPEGVEIASVPKFFLVYGLFWLPAINIMPPLWHCACDTWPRMYPTGGFVALSHFWSNGIFQYRTIVESTIFRTIDEDRRRGVYLYITKHNTGMVPTPNTCRDRNYFLLFLVQSGQTDGQTESDAYEPTVQFAQVGSKRQYGKVSITVISCSSVEIRNFNFRCKR